MGLPSQTVFKIKQPNFPQFLFEYHEDCGRVYVIGLPGKFVDRVFVPDLTPGKAQAFVLAEHCDTHARAYGFVQTFLRGYRQGLADEQRMALMEAPRSQVGYEDAGLGGPKVDPVPNVRGDTSG